jgi:tryptophan synthase alpha chain
MNPTVSQHGAQATGRLAARFKTLRDQSRAALIPFVTAGDPQPAATVAIMQAMVAAGADIIELGIPFSDPMAEGPVIQRASERALAHHVSLRHVLQMVREFRQLDTDTPVVLMGYLNPIEVMGYQTFAHEASQAGADGVITVDLPPEEGLDYIAALRAEQLEPIFLLAPTSTEARMANICSQAGGFVYYVSLKGVTGAASLDVSAVADKVAQIRRHTDMPVGVGFGIKDAASAAQVAQIADAVVIGSALVRLVEDFGSDQSVLVAEITRFLGGVRTAMDNAKAKG